MGCLGCSRSIWQPMDRPRQHRLRVELFRLHGLWVCRKLSGPGRSADPPVSTHFAPVPSAFEFQRRLPGRGSTFDCSRGRVDNSWTMVGGLIAVKRQLLSGKQRGQVSFPLLRKWLWRGSARVCGIVPNFALYVIGVGSWKSREQV